MFLGGTAPNTCTACGDYATECDNATTATACTDGYFISGGTCTTCHDTADIWNCGSCSAQSSDDSVTASEANSLCTSCTSVGVVSSFTANDNTHVFCKACGLLSSACDNSGNCTAAVVVAATAVGAYVPSSPATDCVACEALCHVCAVGGATCTTCVESDPWTLASGVGHRVDSDAGDGSCTTCSNNCYSCTHAGYAADDLCETCNTGYFIDTGNNKGCAACTGCTECIEGDAASAIKCTACD